MIQNATEILTLYVLGYLQTLEVEIRFQEITLFKSTKQSQYKTKKTFKIKAVILLTY